MNEHDDRYREWDAAYVLGSLDADEQEEFERHLADCDRCTTAVAELAEIPRLLAMVPANEAVASLAGPASTESPPRDTFPRLVAAAGAQRRRARRRIVTAGAAVAAVAAGLALVLPGLIGADDAGTNGATTGRPAAIELTEAAPTSINATVRLTERPWGTEIEGECHYQPAAWEGSSSRYNYRGPVEYAMYVTDADGESHRVATWAASPGMTVTPRATVDLPVTQVASVDIRSVNSGQVLLEREV